ncbi:hypothetical protein PPTG_24196 [Phytophthora nicotianae INRA-310]|nr:hypothetical protein PPTG_24196 [Phytophthora nicotianae INRA-310]ETN00868.1 hypothetical protein PPTG_24196 [Phytophthora nicotianae INRA-310]
MPEELPDRLPPARTIEHDTVVQPDAQPVSEHRFAIQT